VNQSNLHLIECHITIEMARRLGGASSADVTDRNTISVFRQAVTSRNSTNNTNLPFVSIQAATKHVVSGFNFKGIINVTNNGAREQYDVTVWQKAGGRSIDVTNFREISTAE
jgi:hypothetical protein